MKPVVELLTSSVAPGTWRTTDESGGAPQKPNEVGSITPFYLSQSLIVRHTAEVHDQLAERLRQLRKIRELQDPEGAHEEPHPVVSDPFKGPADQGAAAPKVEIRGPARRCAGTLARYEVVLENPGVGPLEGVRLKAVVPAGATPELATGAVFDPNARTLALTPVRLKAGEKKVLRFGMRFEKPGTVRVVAMATPANAPGVTFFTHTTVLEGLADLAVEVTEPERCVDLGEETTYRIRVVNRGTKAAGRVSVKAVLSANLEPVTTRGGPSALYNASEHTVVFPEIGGVGPGDASELDLMVAARKEGTGACRVRVTHDGLDEPLEAMEVVKVLPAAP